MVATENPPDAPVGDPPRASRGSRFTPQIVLAAAVVVAAIALLWMAGEAHYRGCVEAAQARYPSVPVSAFNTEGTGPLKLSFEQERRAAVNDCGRLPL